MYIFYEKKIGLDLYKIRIKIKSFKIKKNLWFFWYNICTIIIIPVIISYIF